ncbi:MULTISPECIES: hypothetical protein [Azospirillum]|uniref:hypothetical protein n=1 Tax=Azospirillum TaxID=191 RepID=UPI0013B461F1|nr:hypothetical protein [Azospirillum brasilense]
MEMYSVGFIAVTSQKLSLQASNKDLDEYFKNIPEKDPETVHFMKYCMRTLGYQACGVYRFFRYMKTGPLDNSVMQALASIYAGHFAIFAEKIKGADINRTVAGFNPASLSASMFSTTALKQGGSVEGEWYDDKEMFEDPSRRVISIPVSESVYRIFRDEIDALKNKSSKILSSRNLKGGPLYGWYGLDEAKGKFNCVTAGIAVVLRILSDNRLENSREHGIDDLSKAAKRMNAFVKPLVEDGKGTLTPVLNAMQIGLFLCDNPGSLFRSATSAL